MLARMRSGVGGRCSLTLSSRQSRRSSVRLICEYKSIWVELIGPDWNLGLRGGVMPIALPESVTNVLEDKAYGHVVTLNPSGRPQ